MKYTKFFLLFFSLLFASAPIQAQENRNFAERLGYPKDAKLLIIHADDLGLSHSVNKAGIIAFEKKGITSGSIMVPCPWFAEFADYAKIHPELDLGIHLTLTAEWKHYKWGGVSPSTEIPSLLNEKGFFYSSVEEVGRYAIPQEVEKEVRAQIERALAFGVDPTHIDTHMGSIIATPELFQIYLKIGKEYDLPVFIPMNYFQSIPEEIKEMLGPDQIMVDNFYMLYEDGSLDNWFEAYKKILMDLNPGLNQIIVHPGIDDAELQAVTIDHQDYGAAWRQRDLDFVLSDEMKSLIDENNVYLITWKEIKKILRSSSK